LKVCHVITKLELGGAQQNTLYTVSHMDRRRFEPILVTGKEGMLVDEAIASGVPTHLVDSLVREISPVRDAAALARLTRLLRRERPDIVHTHSSKAGILGRWAATLAGVPLIVHSIHGFGFHEGQSRLLRESLVALERLTGRFATTAFVAVSRANIETGLDLELFPEERVCLIRSGIRLERFRPADAPGNGSLKVGMVACLKPQKSPEDFVEVARRVIRAMPPAPPVTFALAGDGELRPAVERQVAEAGLSHLVSLEGWSRDIPGFLRGLDVLLHTSRWEGLPRVFPEAMSTGLPIVATRVDGAPEAIEDSVTGFLRPPGDVEGLAEATVRLLRDEDLRRRMGREARRRVAPWDIDEMVRRQERLYECLAQGAAERAGALSARLENG